MNVTNSETMVDCLKLLCPAVSPSKNERSNFHGIFDRNLSQSIAIGHIRVVVLVLVGLSGLVIHGIFATMADEPSVSN